MLEINSEDYNALKIDLNLLKKLGIRESNKRKKLQLKLVVDMKLVYDNEIFLGGRSLLRK